MRLLAAVRWRPFALSFLYLRGMQVCTWLRMEPALVEAKLVIYLFDSRKFLASNYRFSSMFGYLYGMPVSLMCLILSSKLTRSSLTLSAVSFSMLTFVTGLVFL